MTSVGMTSVQHLHLDHALQIVSMLEAVVLRGFGPDGGQVLFIRDTGQAMLSRSGTKILSALRLEHPLARMVVECVLKHSKATGDGSKTFIILLASLLRMIHATALQESNMSHTNSSRESAVASTARHLAEKLLAIASEDLDDLIALGVVQYGCCLPRENFNAKTQSQASDHCVQKLLASFFRSRLGDTHCDFISSLTCELLSNWKVKNDHPSVPLQFISDNLPALHTPVSGFPISNSRWIDGQVIHRDFATPWPQSHQHVKAIICNDYLQPKVLHAGEVLELVCGDDKMEQNSRKGRSIVEFSTWAERTLGCAIAKLQSLGVSVLLSAVKQSAAFLASATQAGLSVVECVSDDELFLFAHQSGAKPVTECWMIEPDHVVTLAFCKPILLGAHRYVHVGFHESEKRLMGSPCSLIVCGPGEGQTDQYVCAIQDAIRMLLSTWEPLTTKASQMNFQSQKCKSSQEDCQIPNSPPYQQCVFEPGCVVPAGGMFEFLLHRALLQHGRSCSFSKDTDMDIPAVFQLLANALLSVPRQIYSHSPKGFLQAQTGLLTLIENHSQPFSLENKDRNSTEEQGGGKCPLQEEKQGMHCCLLSKLSVLGFGLESVSCKSQLLMAVLQCLSNLFQVDTILYVHTALHTRSRRLASISWEGSEDEAEE